MLLEANYERPNLCNRIACIAKAAGGVRSIDTLFAVARVQCKLRRIEARLWEASNSEGFVWPTTVRGAERCECRRLGVGHGGWACSGILHDLLQAFDRRRSAHKVAALVAALEWQVSSCEPNEGVRSPPGSSSCCWWNRCEKVRTSHPTVQIRVVVDDLSLQHLSHHKCVAQERECASKCLATKLTQADEAATVLSRSMSVRARLQVRLTPHGVQVSSVEGKLEVDFTSGKRASTTVCRARLETSKGCVKRIRKIHGRSSVPTEAPAGDDYASSGGTRLGAAESLSRGSMKHRRSSPGHRWRRAWQSVCIVQSL